jgi:hypothetical protein
MTRGVALIVGAALLTACVTADPVEAPVPRAAPVVATPPPRCIEWQVGDERIAELEFVETPPEVIALRGDVKAEYAVRIAGGVVLGINEGEWGGGLLVRTDAGKRVDLDTQNVAGLLALPDGDALAALGLAHMGDDGGWVVRVSASDGEPRIVARERLASAPNLAKPTRAGWLVVMANDQAVLVQPDLSLQPVACATLFTY